MQSDDLRVVTTKQVYIIVLCSFANAGRGVRPAAGAAQRSAGCAVGAFGQGHHAIAVGAGYHRGAPDALQVRSALKRTLRSAMMASVATIVSAKEKWWNFSCYKVYFASMEGVILFNPAGRRRPLPAG